LKQFCQFDGHFEQLPLDATAQGAATVELGGLVSRPAHKEML